MSDVDPGREAESEAETRSEAQTEPTEADRTSLTEDDYALGDTSDPDGASRDEPAGEDYAGSGF